MSYIYQAPHASFLRKVPLVIRPMSAKGKRYAQVSSPFARKGQILLSLESQILALLMARPSLAINAMLTSQKESSQKECFDRDNSSHSDLLSKVTASRVKASRRKLRELQETFSETHASLRKKVFVAIRGSLSKLLPLHFVIASFGLNASVQSASMTME